MVSKDNSHPGIILYLTRIRLSRGF